MGNSVSKKDIAVIGLSCRFPKSEDIEKFWEQLKNGSDLIHTYSEEELLEFGMSDAEINDPNFKKVGAAIDGAEHFDYHFFGYTRDEARVMDPQTRLMHQQVWLALEDAAINADQHLGTIGLYLSPQKSYDWVTHLRVNPNENVDSFLAYRLADSQFMSSLISYKLNLTGPSMVLDTACSSSLTAIHVACRNLLLRECNVAVAGGVSLGVIEKRGYYHREGMVMSKDGRCKPFDKESSGIVSGEGAGVVVLKRLEEALADGDPIYAVIKASAVNNDGNRKVGYTAPSVLGQSKCISTAYQFADIDPLTVGYIEAHGTGTQLGDPVEVAALNKVFKNDSSHECAIGSVKSNMGHLDTAAGVAGFIKAALAVHHRQIPPTLHFTEPNPSIDFDSGPFYVNPKLKNWKSVNGQPIRAGVSSLGIGGTNAHIVLQEAPQPIESKSQRRHHLITFSAKTSNSLTKNGKKLQEYLASHPEVPIGDIAFTSKTSRSAMNLRDFVVCKSHGEGSELLQNKTIETQQGIGGKKQLVFMFPGQGSQYPAMAKALYDEEPFFREIMDDGFEFLEELTGEDFKSVIGYDNTTPGDVGKINKTLYTQPTLFLVQYALARLLQHWRIEPDRMIGHSLGEFTAACIAGVFSFHDGLKILAERARLMNSLPEGDMLAVGATHEEVKQILPPQLSIAAINTADSCTISGKPELINDFTSVLEKQEIPFKLLKTSHAFHSEMMDAILPEFEAFMGTVKLSAPGLPFVSNGSGDLITSEESTSPKYWTRHLREAVAFNQGLDTLLDNNRCILIEVGPGRTLSGFCRHHKEFKKNKSKTIQLLGHPAGDDDDSKIFTNAIGELWTLGIEIDWEVYHEHEQLNKVRIPTYQFEEHVFRSRIKLSELYSQLGLLYQASSESGSEFMYTLNWKKSIQQKESETTELNDNYLLFTDRSQLSDSIKEILESEGKHVIEVAMGKVYDRLSERVFVLNPANERDFTTLFKTLEDENLLAQQIVVNWSSQLSHQGSSYENIFCAHLALCKGLINYGLELPKKLTLLGRNVHKVLGNEKINVTERAGLSIGMICAQENPQISTHILDLDTDDFSPASVRQIVSDLEYNGEEDRVSYRNGQRWIPFYEKLESTTSKTHYRISKNKNYLLTGGLGPVGSILTAHLCDTYDARVIIVGRSELPPAERWEVALKNTTGSTEDLEKIRYLKEHLDKGRKVHYKSLDISDRSKTEALTAEIEMEFGPLSGIIHAAGNSSHETFQAVEEIDRESIRKQFAPKVTGTQNIYEVFGSRSLDFVWITSSISTVLGGLTYGAYVGANSFLDGFYAEKKDELPNWYCVNLDGLSANGMSGKQLIEAFERSFQVTANTPLIVSSRDLHQRLAQQKEKATEADETSVEEIVIARPEIQVDYIAPVSEVEIALCEIWQNFFGYEKLGLEDNFFELGGDSLKAMTVVKRINKAFNISLSLKDFFLKATISQIASEIEMIQELQSIQAPGEGRKTIKI